MLYGMCSGVSLRAQARKGGHARPFHGMRCSLSAVVGLSVRQPQNTCVGGLASRSDGHRVAWEAVALERAVAGRGLDKPTPCRTVRLYELRS